jgi:phosphoribosyl 1,2-cyclic phosphate phosphodiesterase
MTVELTILGCGNSTGVPAVGNQWGACDAKEPKNRRMRPSIFLKSTTTSLVIDTGPDFAMQCNMFGITKLDAIIYTHMHGDHVNGIDDLRVWVKKQEMDTLPAYGTQATLDELGHRFDYMFKRKSKLYPQALTPHYLDESLYRAVTIGDINLVTFLQDHGTMQTLGLRIGNVGYSTDMKALDDRGIDMLRGIDTWIVDCGGYGYPSPMVHANLETVQHLNQSIGAKQIYFTHMPGRMDYNELCRDLPQGYKPAYDGLKLQCR